MAVNLNREPPQSGGWTTKIKTHLMRILQLDDSLFGDLDKSRNAMDEKRRDSRGTWKTNLGSLL